ncbi:hypothetical protein BU17DRAFT_82268 [Hysterangium stoloniferum]|nr:hypothetical protein BU17DRAFT_82268 [Hysterangium stoloniferum]
MDQSSSDITRIQIERVEDWKRVEDNFTTAMLEILSQKLAQSPSEHWRDRTFNAAKQNLRVNGHNLEDYVHDEDDTEPFDEVLDRRIWSLSTERMTWDKELADRRRTAPAEIQYLVEDLLARERATGHISPVKEASEQLDVDQARLPREMEVAEICNQTMSILDNLKSTIPQVLDRTERAHEVAEEIKRFL